jgi:acetolactate synthase I/II/III large subunit
MAEVISHDARWGEYPGEEWSDAMVQAMKLGGVDHLFFVSGSEIAFWQESIAKANEKGWPAPKLITVPHESVALNAALGSAMIRNQPAATAVHVDVGTLNYGGAIHTAWRGNYPVLITAGTGPRAYAGSMTGARNSPVQWVQEPRDQGGIVRQYTKMDHRLEHQDNPGFMISRLLQVAMSEPKGPVYLSAPRESAMLKLPGKSYFPTRDELGIARPAWPDPADAKRAAQWLIEARNPLICCATAGRNPEAVAEILRLAELLALPVLDCDRMDRLNFPTSHGLYGTGPQIKDADALLMLEALVPYISPSAAPKPGSKVIWADADPVMSAYKTMDFQADLWLPVATAAAARAIHDAATALLSKSDMSRIADRREQLAARKRELQADNERAALQAGRRNPMHPRWVAYQLGQILEPNSILLDDSISNSDFVCAHHGRSQAGTYFASGGSSGGWGSGAALGAKLAAPDRDVVLSTGDGYFMFGTPMPALWTAAHYKAAFLTLVFVNRSYTTGTNGLVRTYPEGVAVRNDNFEGGVFDPPPDFAKLAEAGNSYGETVREPEEVAPALQRGLDQVRKGTPALIAAYLPTLVEEMKLRHGM